MCVCWVVDTIPATKRNLHRHERKTRQINTQGDIVEIHPDGAVKVVDRKKDLIKLSGGEYLSLGKAEGVVKRSAYVDNCCVFADPLKAHCVVIVTKAEGLADVTDADVLQDIQRLCKEHGFHPFEIPRACRVLDDEWTPENGFTTAAMKLKRKAVTTHYRACFEELYKGLS